MPTECRMYYGRAHKEVYCSICGSINIEGIEHDIYENRYLLFCQDCEYEWED